MNVDFKDQEIIPGVEKEFNMFKNVITLSLLSSLIGCGSSTSVKSLITKHWSCTKVANSRTFKYDGIVYSTGTLTSYCEVTASGSTNSSTSTQTNTLETDISAFYCPVSQDGYWTFTAPSGVKTATDGTTTVTFASSDCS